MYIKLLLASASILFLSNISLAQPDNFDQPCLGTDQFADLAGVVTINGVPAVPGEDFVAFFDSDGFVVGSGGVTEQAGFCPQGVVSFVNVPVFGSTTLPGTGCPDGFGLNAGESFAGLIFDGSTGLYYELTVDPPFTANSTLNLSSGGFCSNTDATVLPAVLTAFRGQVAGPKHIQLSWNVAREENVSHYEVQRSSNGSDWNILDDVAAAGDSETALTYSFDDLNPEGLRQFYRLRMVDLDGAEEFSGIVITELDQTGERTVNTFPNPASPTTRLSIQLGGEWNPNIPIKASLYDLNGRVLTDYNALQAGTSSVAIPSEAKAGLYLLRVTQANAVFTHKISLQ